jgi:hypothetical protein
MVRTVNALILVVIFTLDLSDGMQAQNSFSPSGSPRDIRKEHILTSSGNNFLDSTIMACLAEISADSIKSTMLHLQNFGTRFSMASNRKQVAEWIKQKYFSYGYTDVQVDSFQTITQGYLGTLFLDTTTWQYNVTATLQGLHNPGLTCMTGGHYDSYSLTAAMTQAPGADDNASGTAAVMEMARAMKAAGYQPNRTLKFVAFAAEEILHLSENAGSDYAAAQAAANQEKIVLFINHDMVANDVHEPPFQVIDIHYTDESLWAAMQAKEMAEQHTITTPNLVHQEAAFCDAEAFWREGYPTLYLFEHDLDPEYHSVYDVVDSCDIGYAAEACRISTGMMIAVSEKPEPVKGMYIRNAGNGSDLMPCWEPGQENHLSGYKVYIGRQPGMYDSAMVTCDTSFLFSGLLQDTTYYIAVSVFNQDGCESLLTEKRQAPALVTLAEGVLVVNGSTGGLGNPDPEAVRAFYDTLCAGTTFTHFDASGSDHVPLGILGRYSSLLWHVENYQCNSTALYNSRDEIRNYLEMGGHCLFTLYNPSRLFQDDDGYPFTFQKGSFMNDVMHVEASENATNRWFWGAVPSSGSDSLYVDPVKAGVSTGQIFFVEVLTSSPGGETMYLYDSKYDSTSAQGSYTGKPVGIQNAGSEKNLVLLSFPLYYIHTEQAVKFVFSVLHDRFHEDYAGVSESRRDCTEFSAQVYPNPCWGPLKIDLCSQQPGRVRVRLFDLCGRFVRTVYDGSCETGKMTLETSVRGLLSGVYTFEITAGEARQRGKLIIMNAW